MEILRRNTDYALRMVTALAKHFDDGQMLSARQLATDCNFSYELARKLLQKLRNAKLVKSVMGSSGGFKLNRKPSEISLMEVINVLQGEIYLNKCMADDHVCEFEVECEVNTKLAHLQQLFDNYLQNVTMEEILQGKSKKTKNKCSNKKMENANKITS